MNITVNPNAAAHAPTVAAHGPNALGRQTLSTPPATTEAPSEAVEISLSPAARQALGASAPGSASNSPAHQARRYIADSPAGVGTGPDPAGPFGQVVKTFTPGHLRQAALVDPNAVPGGDDEVPGATDPAGGTEASGDTSGIAGGTEVTEVLDDGAPADDGTAESGIAGSSDDVTSAGDDESENEPAPAGSSEPPPVVVGEDPTAVLLEALEGESEETI